MKNVFKKIITCILLLSIALSLGACNTSKNDIKKFGVIERTSNANKLRGLLKDLGLTERFVSSMDELESVVNQEIDYDPVFCLLEAEQKRTEKYLQWALVPER